MKKSYTETLSKADWLSLSFLEGIGPARLSRLYTYLNHPSHSQTQSDAIDSSSNHSLFEDSTEPESTLSYDVLRALKWPETTARQAMDYLSNSFLTEAQTQKREAALAWLEQTGRHIILQGDSDYPEELKEINTAPAFLYLEGHRDALTLPKIGIVGARKCTRHGHDTTFQFAKQLSDHGVCIVSGGAMGIDTAAHQGALESQVTPTIAVMGTGLLHRYPQKNTSLFDQIVEQGGALISEYPLMTSPKPHLFPPRNRIISGLTAGILVAEASIKSGSLISASYAVQQNREVFAFPGRLSDKQSEGCHQLLRQGATLVRHVDDVLDECILIPSRVSSERHLSPSEAVLKKEELKQNALSHKQKASEKVNEKTRKDRKEKLERPMASVIALNELPQTLSEEAKHVALILENESEAMDFDALIRHSTLNADVMMQALMELELSLCVDNREGLYHRC